MKPWIKILFTGFVILVIFFALLYIFMVFWGKALIINKLHELTQKKVTMDYVDITPPFTIHIKNLNIEGLAKVDSVSVAPSIPSFLLGKIGFNNVRIISPEINYERKAPEKSELVAITAPANAPTALAPSPTVAVTLPPATTPAQSKPETAPAPPAAPTPAPETKSASAQATAATMAGAAFAPIAALVPMETAPAPGPVQEEQQQPLRLIFKRFSIKDGKLNFNDQAAGASGIKIVIKDVNFNLTNFYTYPTSAITYFKLKGRIPWLQGQEEGKIDLDGWLNFAKKDMQATFKVADIDGIYLYPYYSQWVDLEKARIEKAKLNFTSNMQGLNDNLTAECHLELTDIVRKPRPEEEVKEKAEKMTDDVIDIFKTLDQGKIVLDFTIRTKMTRPELGFGSIKMAFEDKITRGTAGKGIKPQHLVILPLKLLEGMIRGTTDLSKAVIGGTFAIGREIKDSVEDTFKK